MKYFVVSDIHSYYMEFKKAIDEAGFDENNPDHMLVICGDIMDRGDESIMLQSYILCLLYEKKVILIRGNHEDLMLQLVNDVGEYWYDISLGRSHHVHNGTVKTAIDLTGKDFPWREYSECENWAKEVAATPFVQTIIPKMVDYYETPHYIFVHGWIPCITQDMPPRHKRDRSYSYNPDWRQAKEKDWESARWFNGIEVHSLGVKEPNKTIVCGHWHCSYGNSLADSKIREFPSKGSKYFDEAFKPYYNDGIIAIDACTAYSGKVNCVVIED